MRPRQPGSAPAAPPPGTHISFSAISTYQVCPLRYKFRYIDAWPEDTVAASLVLGGAIHRALQVHFTDLRAGRPPPSLDNLLEAFCAEWHRRDHQRIVFDNTQSESDLVRLARRMLRAFQHSKLARPGGTIRAVEEPLRGVVVPGVPDLLARIDLVVETDAELLLVDFKTARASWSDDHVWDAAGQLILYGELVRAFAPGKPLRLEFGVLTKAKFPEVIVHEVSIAPRLVARTKSLVERVWRAIDGQHFFPTPSPLHCPSCPYRTPCRTWTG